MVSVNYLEHILTHSKLSVLLLLLSVSTIINFKCIYMHTEKYIPLYNLTEKKKNLMETKQIYTTLIATVDKKGTLNLRSLVL